MHLLAGSNEKVPRLEVETLCEACPAGGASGFAGGSRLFLLALRCHRLPLVPWRRPDRLLTFPENPAGPLQVLWEKATKTLYVEKPTRVTMSSLPRCNFT